MDVTLENNARRILRQLYSGGFEVRRVSTDSSAVFFVDFSDGRESVVLKLPKSGTDEVLREQRILDSLDSISIPVPPVLYTQENQPIDGMVYTITRRIQGPSLKQVIKADDHQTEDIFTQLGRLTAEISAIPLTLVPDALQAERTQADELHWWELHQSFVERHRLTTRPLEVVYHAARGIMLNPPSVYGHRDAVQAVTDGSSVYVVDVGSSGANWPDADFARLLYAGVAWYEGGDLRVWREAVQAAYLENRDLSDADVERIIIFMLYYAMRDASHYASSGRANHVDGQFEIATHILRHAREWFGR